MMSIFWGEREGLSGGDGGWGWTMGVDDRGWEGGER